MNKALFCDHTLHIYIYNVYQGRKVRIRVTKRFTKVEEVNKSEIRRKRENSV